MKRLGRFTKKGAILGLARLGPMLKVENSIGPHDDLCFRLAGGTLPPNLLLKSMFTCKGRVAV